MDPGFIDWINLLTKLGFPVSTIIMGALWWIERTERVHSERRHREERETDREEARALTRDSILANQSAASAVSTLTSLLGAPKRGRG